MTSSAREPGSLDRLLQAIPRILNSSSLDDSLAEALELLRRGSGATAAVVFFADGDAPLREHWAPDNASIKSSLRPRLKVEALEAIRRSGPHLTIADGAAQNGHVTRTVLLATESGPLGAVALAWSADRAPEDPKTRSWIAAAIELVSSTAISRREISKLKIQAERDKRWFKTLDEHLRVLDRERQKFAAVVNQTDTFVFVTDEDRIIRWNNRAMAVLLPFQDEASSWVGKPCSDVCARLGRGGEDSDTCDCPIRRSLERNEVTHQEMRFSVRGADGVLYLTALPIKGLDGTPHEAMILIQDLTGLETLRQSEVRYNVLFERNPEAILMVDPETREILLANPAAQRMLGYSAQEIVRHSLQSLHPGEEWERVKGFYELASRQTTPTRAQCRILTREGDERIALVSSTRVGLEGRNVDLIGMADVTSSVQAEQELGETQARHRAMIETALDAIVSMDHAGRILEFNPAAERIFGHKREDVLGRDMAELIIPADLRERHRQGMEHYLASGEGRVLGQRMEIPALRSDGSVFPVELTIARISSKGPPVFTGFIRDLTERASAEEALRSAEDVATDITERKNLEAQLRHAEKMEAVGRLAGGVAHDFNNLLTVIKGHSEVMLAKMPPRDALRLSAEEIQKAGARGALLTRQLLAFSRRDLSSPEVLDLGDVVRGLESMLQRLIGEGVRLVTRTGGWPLHVRADRGQLEQVLANLAVNGRDAMPEGGDLTIEVSATELASGEPRPGTDLLPGPYAVLTVSDQGCGMSAEVLGHLFEPFFTTKEHGKGSGMGLSVVFGIVRQSGGDVLVESEPGRGATFRIFLPRVGGREPALVGASGKPPGHAAKEEGTVLLVEDESAVRALARDFLHLFGYEVLDAGSGEEALKLFQKHKDSIRIVVSDIIMPGMGGVDLARRLVAQKPDLKVLLVSGYAEDSLDDRDACEGFSFMQKPYSLEHFGRRIAELLAGSSVGDRTGTG